MLAIVFDERRLERTHRGAFREFDRCQFEVRGWAAWEMNKHDRI